MTALTTADIEARRYVYVSVTFENPLGWAKVVVPKMRPAEAAACAQRIAEKAIGREATEVRCYGSNYVRNAREVHAAGGIAYKAYLDAPLVPANDSR